MRKDRVAILLATYNGEEYLREQIDSLYSQTYSGWSLYIHDDGSTDNTMAIINDYSSRHDNITVFDYPSRHGARDNFFSLIQAVDADYYFFCDQDDVWLPGKIATEMEKMHEAETASGDIPVIVHTDAYVVTRGLKVISPSLWTHTNTHPEMMMSFDDCVRTVVTGCTMCFNRAAKATLVHPSATAIMHDCWLFLCVMRVNGKAIAVHEPTMLYRQHHGNTLGARQWEKKSLIGKLRQLRTGLHDEIAYYMMLRELGYGSYLKFRINLMRYRRLLKKNRI